MPRAIEINETTLRIFFSSRNEMNQSLPYWIDVDSRDMTVKAAATSPMIELGDTGAFDQDGVMPCAAYNDDDLMTVLYIGWQRTHGAPYRTSVCAMVLDNGQWVRQELRYISLPYGITTIFADNLNGHAYYAAFSEWRSHTNPVYNIPQVKHLHPDHCTCAPVVIRDADGRMNMYYSARSINYYKQRDNSYRICKAVQLGDTWMAAESGIDVSVDKNEWDYQMVCYADVLYLRDRYVMFYNGNEFGRYGFGYAETEAL
jgi:hypothetical protein